MKWDHTKNPPQAWYVEDGDWVPVDPTLVIKCPICEKWFLEDPFKPSNICSPACRLRKLEK
jgi:hypothetical protein